jgi:dipeptidyl aminopeptidase/acylaminoacyl peptidase
VRRRQFIFANRGLTLDGGLVHEPGAAAGPGPFPILVTIYPGEARSWEGVSAPLAARGYVVVSYFPRRLLDLEGDLDDLRLLLNLARAGQFSARGDPASVALVGGSVSTVYTYALARSLAGSPAGEGVRAAVQYGGLFDLFAFRRSWEEGRVAIDPGISALEYLLVAFGRPDTRPELYLRLSPRYGLGPGDLPPTLLVHTERDTIVPPEQSQLAADALARLAIPRRLLRYPDLEHYLDVSRRDPAQLDMLEQTVAFLRRYTGR